MKLYNESQLLTTFIIPLGRFCCARGWFGLTSMQEIFNKCMDSIINSLPGVAKSTDNFLAYGKTNEEHDICLNQVLQRFKDKGVTLNKKKCVFKVKQNEFLGDYILPDGVKPLKSKISAITNYPTPTNLNELCRFMGMTKQLSKFTNYLAQPLNHFRNYCQVKAPTHGLYLTSTTQIDQQN